MSCLYMPERNEVLICAPDNLMFDQGFILLNTLTVLYKLVLSFVKHGRHKCIVPQCEMEVIVHWFVL